MEYFGWFTTTARIPSPHVVRRFLISRAAEKLNAVYSAVHMSPRVMNDMCPNSILKRTRLSNDMLFFLDEIIRMTQLSGSPGLTISKKWTLFYSPIIMDDGTWYIHPLR